MTIQPLSPQTSISSGVALPESIAAPDPEPLLPTPTSGASKMDVGLAIATLSIDSAFERRKSAHVLKDSAEHALADSEASQLANMHTAADDKLYSARINAAGEMLSGLVSAGVGVSALKTPKDAEGSLAIGRGASSISTATSKLCSADDDRDASDAEVRAKAAEQAGGHLKDALGDAKDEIEASRDTVRKALDFLKEYESTQSQTAAAALHRA